MKRHRLRAMRADEFDRAGPQLDRCWNSSARLRQEFGDSKSGFLAFVKAVVTDDVRASLPSELVGIFPGVPVDSPPKGSRE